MTRIPSRAVRLTWILLPFLLDTAVLLPSARAADDQLAQLRAERKKLAHRERGIIYSNDGCDACFEATEPTAENLLKQRAIPHLTDHVGSVFYSTTFSLGLYWHHAAVPGVDLYTQPHVKTGRNIVGGLIAKGTDPLEIMVDFYHEHDRELFSNVRMNDIHDAGYYRYGNIPKWKLTHPEWLFGAIRRDPEAAAKVLAERRFDPYRRYFDPELSRYVVDKRPPATEGWSGADFSVPEVREMVFRVLEDICRRYDADGIQLDFLRHPPYFKSVAWGEEITQEQTDVMTGLVRRIREMTEREGLRRGRPILVSVRILGSVAMNEAQGLDISRWLEKDLIDLMVVGWVQEAPLKPMVELSRQYHVPVYMHMHRNRGGVRGSLEGQRARAMMAYADGADGVYLFNYFDPMWLPLFSELGDRQQLQRLDKVYCTMPMGSYGLLARFVKNAVPLIGVPTVAAVAAAAGSDHGSVLIPAVRGRLYRARLGGGCHCIASLDAERIAEIVATHESVAGDIESDLVEALERAGARPIPVTPEASAAAVARLAQRLLEGAGGPATWGAVPRYVAPPTTAPAIGGRSSE